MKKCLLFLRLRAEAIRRLVHADPVIVPHDDAVRHQTLAAPMMGITSVAVGVTAPLTSGRVTFSHSDISSFASA